MVLLKYIIKQQNCNDEELYQINPKFNNKYNDTLYYEENNDKELVESKINIENENDKSIIRYINAPKDNNILNEERKFIQLQKRIEENKEYLEKKQIEEEEDKITFLNDVKDDYEKYYNYIKNQKEQQVQALNFLENYFSALITRGKLSNENILEAKKEQDKIIKTINSIKNNLEELITNK